MCHLDLFTVSLAFGSHLMVFFAWIYTLKNWSLLFKDKLWLLLICINQSFLINCDQRFGIRILKIQHPIFCIYLAHINGCFTAGKKLRIFRSRSRPFPFSHYTLEVFCRLFLCWSSRYYKTLIFSIMMSTHPECLWHVYIMLWYGAFQKLRFFLDLTH